MARVIIFSRVFPAYHPKKGEPTHFVEKLIKSLDQIDFQFGNLNRDAFDFFDEDFYNEIATPKHHTIRVGKRWKVGDKFSPRVWSGKPYRSKMITIAPDVEVKKVWDIGLRIRGDFKEFYCNDADITTTSIELLSMNDGLLLGDFISWFNKPFEGQIICWNESINY